VNPSVVLPALVAIAVLFVLLPVAAATFLYYRRPKAVWCPVDGQRAVVRIDADAAAMASLTDAHRRLVAACTFWPARSGCRQDCLTEPMHELLDTGSARPSPARRQA